MEGNALPPQNSNPVPDSTGKKAVKGFTLLKMGILEIAFVGVTLLLFFGILNYFNILSVSRAFPEYLSWLPRQETISEKQILYTPVTPKPSSTPADFQYNVKKAETLLNEYVRDNIKSEFIPEKIDINQGQQIDGNPGRIKNEFGSKFTSSTASFFVNFHFLENTNDPNDFTIFIQPNNIDETTLTASLTNSLTSRYFNNPSTTSSCTSREIISVCNAVTTNANEKREFGAFFATSNGNDYKIIFTCSTSKRSKKYVTYKSCINF